MIRRFALALAMLVATAAFAHAATLDEVLALHYKAMGGLDKMKAMKTIRYTGKMAMGPGMEAPFVLEKARPKKMRMEFQFQGMTLVQAYDDSTGWMINPFTGKKDPEPMPAEALKQMDEQADFDGQLVDWKAKGHQAELIGEEDIEGAKTYKVKLTLKDGDVTNYYIDSESGLLLKQEGKRTMRGTEVEGETSLGDYKEVEGMMMPFAMESGAKGSQQKQKMTLEKIEVNPALAADRFVMPAIVKSDSTAVPPADAKATAKPADEKSAPKKNK